MRVGQSDAVGPAEAPTEPVDPQGGRGVAQPPAAVGRDGSTPDKFFCKTAIREADLAAQFGVARPVLSRLRLDKLREGVDWFFSAPPRRVMVTEAGVEALRGLLGLPKGEALAEQPAGGHRIPDDQIPKGPQNGLLLEHGRPGWWTADEAVVLANGFANRRAILVEFAGRQVICRVRDARNFHPRMVIPVRPYGNIVVAARHPRFPGKW